MKIKLILTFAFALCLFTGCGGETVPEAPVQESSTATSTTSSTSTAEAVTTAVTHTTTTTKAEPPKDLIMKGLDTVEVYGEITIGDFITDTNVELKNADALLDTSELGEFKAKIPYIYEGGEFSAEVKYTVVDSTEPVLLNSGWTPYHKRGTPFDLGDYVGFADNYDPTPVLTYTGDIDPDTVGTYPLTATVTDSSGNQISWDVTILVLDQIPAPEDNNTRVNYEDFIARYDGNNVRFGIDVSAWQGNIDFKAVKEAGCSFVIMRIGYCYGEVEMDDYFRANIEGASAAGLDIGVYLYTTDNTVEGVKTNAAWIAEQLEGRELDFPVAFDWENFGTFQKYGMSIHDLNELYGVFAEEMESYGYSAMLYSSKNFLNNFWSEKSKNSSPVWLAHYVNETDYTGEYAIWQESAYGRIPGITGDVDMNIQYMDKPLS